MKASKDNLIAFPGTRQHVSGTEEPAQSPVLFPGKVSNQWLTRLTLLLSDFIGLCTVINILLIVEVFTGMSLPPFRPLILSFSLFPLAYISFGLYRIVVLKPETEIVAYAKANLAVLAGLSIPVMVVPRFQLDMMLWLLCAAPLMFLIMPFFRVLTRIMFSSTSWWGSDTLVITNKQLRQSVVRRLRQCPESGLNPSLVMEVETVEDTASYSPYHDRSLFAWIQQYYAVKTLVLAVPGDLENALLESQEGTSLFQRVIFMRNESSGHILLTTDYVAENINQGLEPSDLITHGRLTIKYAFDCIGAGVALLVSAPFLISIAFLVKCTSRGPVFFKQRRMGKDGTFIDILKFRTMYVDADAKLTQILDNDPIRLREYEIFHKLRNDPRITPIGRFLRRYSLDELPQLWSVLVGDMSLVGPRAYLPVETALMRGYDVEVMDCLPGLTGLWQVSGRNTLTFDERVSIDVHYKHRWTIALDLYILLKTIPVVMTGNGAS